MAYSFGLNELMEMMVDTRLTYPSSKLTFSIANITKHKVIRFIDIQLILNGKIVVDTVLEDSKRNFMNLFILFFIILFFSNLKDLTFLSSHGNT